MCLKLFIYATYVDIYTYIVLNEIIHPKYIFYIKTSAFVTKRHYLIVPIVIWLFSHVMIVTLGWRICCYFARPNILPIIANITGRNMSHPVWNGDLMRLEQISNAQADMYERFLLL